MSLLHRWSAFVALASVFLTATARADMITLTVDSGLSSLTLSGAAFGLTYTEQIAGSLTANYGGTITADLTGGVFTFSGGSAINALVNPSGSLTSAPHPNGVEAGNYGVSAFGTLPAPYAGLGPQSTNGVYRDIVLDLSAGTANNGAATAATFKFITGMLDFGAAPSGLSGDSNLADESGDNTSASNVSWDGTTLTIPVSFTTTGGNGRTQTWSGNIVAVAVPEPSSFAMISLVGVVGLFRNRSRNRCSLI